MPRPLPFPPPLLRLTLTIPARIEIEVSFFLIAPPPIPGIAWEGPPACWAINPIFRMFALFKALPIEIGRFGIISDQVKIRLGKNCVIAVGGAFANGPLDQRRLMIRRYLAEDVMR